MDRLAVDTPALIEELNLDLTDENTSLVKGLIADSEALILSSLGLDSDSLLADNVIYDRCVKTIATQFYYDRTLSAGLSNGVQLMLIHLQCEVLPDGN